MVIDAAVRAAPDDPLDRIEAVVRAVFRPAVRRPALLGLVREVSRLPVGRGRRLTADLAPLVDRAVAYLRREMDAGRLRRADPRLVAVALLRHGHRHRHRARGAARRRLAAARPPACASCAASCCAFLRAALAPSARGSVGGVAALPAP